MTATDIKTMQLYPRAERIYDDLADLGYGAGAPVPLAVANRFDQLHYHGTEALDAAIQALGLAHGQTVLEIGSGWGGCARYLAAASGAQITALELQEDYHRVAEDLTHRTALSRQVHHVNADFLAWDLPEAAFDHVVSWLALFHIPNRTDYVQRIARTLKPGGGLAVEDLYLIQAPPASEAADFAQHLFPNSLVDLDAYRTSLAEAGLKIDNLTDMTEDWTGFTAERLRAFHANREAYTRVHGADGFDVINTFYTKMAGYFARGLVGGIRYTAHRI